MQNPDAYGETYSFRLPRELSDEVRRLARRDYETRSNVVRRLVRIGLQATRQQERLDPPALMVAGDGQ